jgi:MFS family permease
MHASARLSLAAFFTDFALYLLMLSLPFRVLALDGSALQLGLVPVLYAGPYSLVAATAGHFSDRWPRRGPIRLGLGIAMLGALGLMRAESLASIYWSIPLVGVGLGFFWPSLQAGFSELQQGQDLMRMVSLFNMSWSAGKGSGMLVGGLLLGGAGAATVSLMAAAAFAAAGLVLPAMARPGDHSAVIQADRRRPPARRQRAFLHSAWIANGIGFGVVATVNHHFPRLALGWGIDSSGVGMLLSAVFLSQTLFFYHSGRRRWWHYRTTPLVTVQFVLALVVLGVPWASGLALLIPLGVALGVALGFAYQSSIYYSLDSPQSRGGQAGIHEATLGIASAGIPLTGGWLVAGLGPRAPFALAALCVAGGLAFCASRMISSRASQDGPATASE